MLRRVFLWVLLVGSGALLAQDSYLGVTAFVVRGMTSDDGEIVGFAPRDALRLSVSVVNEEGEEELFLDGGIQRALRLELSVDGEPQGGDLRLSWADTDERWAFSGELPPEPGRAGVLEPAVGLKTELTLRRRDGSPFVAGRYEIRLRVEPQAVKLADGSSWVGRGGLGGVDFELRDEDSAEARLLALKLRAGEAFGTGRYREAAELWAEVVDLDATGDAGWAGLGASFYRLGDHRSAAEYLEKVMPSIAEKGLHSHLPMFLAESYVVLGEIDKARETLRLVVVEPRIESELRQLQLGVAAAATEK